MHGRISRLVAGAWLLGCGGGAQGDGTSVPAATSTGDDDDTRGTTASPGDDTHADGSATTGVATGDDGASTGGADTHGGDTGDTGFPTTDLCSGLQTDDLADHPRSDLDAPAVGASVVDPEFGTTITRIAAGAVPMYSTVSAWNADESRLVLYRPGAGHELYDGTGYASLGALPISPNDLELVYWDTSDPDVLYYPADASLFAYSIASEQSTEIHAFAGCDDVVNAGGDPFFSSFDSDVFGFQCGGRHMILRRSTDAIVGMADSDFELAPQVAPSGARAYWQGLVVDLSLTTVLDLQLDSAFDHASMGWDSRGRDAFLQVAFDGDTVGTLVAHDMQDGSTRVVIGPDGGYPYPPGGTHVSGMAYANPGWAVVSIVGEGQGATLLDGEIVVANWETGAVCRAAHHRSSGEDYFAEPHAVPSPSGTRVLFGSDWAGDTDAYVLELPAHG